MHERGEARTDWDRVDREEPIPDEDSPEPTDEEAAQARPAREVLPEQFGEKAAAEMLRPQRKAPEESARGKRGQSTFFLGCVARACVRCARRTVKSR